MSCEIFLTANRRLSLRLHQQQAQWQLQQGHRTWETPVILPLNTWIEQTWQLHQSPPLLVLNPHQEQLLWQQVIQQHSDNETMLNLPATAALAQQAWQMLQHWNIPMSQLEHSHNEEVNAFLLWSENFQQKCAQQQWCSSAELPLRLQQLLQQNHIKLPPQFHLVGFDELPPAYANLVEQIRQQSSITLVTNDTPIAVCHRLACHDQEHEIKTMAAWAHTLWQSNPQQSIGCIVPNLSECRNKIERVFTETFVLENILPGSSKITPPFNISAGRALSEFPIIHSALQCLTLCRSEISLSQLTPLLTSPYLAQHSQDILFGAMLDAEIRQLNEINLVAEFLLPLFTRLHALQRYTTWLKRWRNVIRWQKQLPVTQTASAWSNAFSELLQLLGWPGSRDIDSVEFQLIERWKKCLIEFTDAEIFQPQWNFNQALSSLKQLIQQTLFQPQGSDGAIQILGLLEAGGNQFDAMWVMGLEDSTWPPAAKPNPFIPHNLQRQYDLPHANAQRELLYTEQTMQRLLQSAKKIIFSYPQQQGDQELHPSHLILPHPEIKADTIIMPQPHPSFLQKIPLECIEDQHGPTLPMNEKVHGSSQLFTLQATCPFRAFATLRLHAHALAEPRLGLTPMQRGILAHAVLERTWEKLNSHATLIALNAEQQDDLINSCITEIIQSARKTETSQLTWHWLQLEQQRLTPLLEQWLNYEKKRSPFTVIGRECEQIITLGNLKLKIKMDRIDQLENGERIIIDYKTGKTRVEDWTGPRPRQPQLLLYCGFANAETATSFSGISFAELRPNAVALRGIWQASATKNMSEFFDLHGETHWLPLVNEWRHTLQNLAQDFCSGKATVDPLEPDACTTCELHSLCRIAH